MNNLDVGRASRRFGIDPDLLQSLIDLEPNISLGKYAITYQEHERRLEKANYAICSVELEGLTVGEEARAIYAQYIAGDLNEDELDNALLGLHGIKP